MQNIIFRFLIPGILITVLSGFTETSSSNTDNKAAIYSDRENAVTQMSENGEYRFSLFTTDPTFPFKKIHNWIIHIENKEGKPVENAKIFVFGGMPEHRHGFPTKPRVKKYLGNGDYLVEGIKFTMPGRWEMQFNIKDHNKTSKSVFQIHLTH